MPTSDANEHPLSVVVSREPTGVPVVVVAGELDIASVDALRAVLLDPGLPSPDLVIDLRGVTFIDSMGLSSLVAGRREVSARGGTVRVLCVPGPVAAILELTRLTEVFEVVETGRVEPQQGAVRRPSA
ncbi:STAS domain-containing protein [Nocardioides mangrovi]|uniref:Anti-sigma factor antagonist n=1 Tax=Nocardioides mangrovi TaxID=2874580 RepID=A0ABS7UBW2_9ACTN|nr:STAS domain-containing protein [Nocardioides mangrovi]MBZ5738201.1 STAS domain-containing protein [Nocardioides mangrovi]